MSEQNRHHKVKITDKVNLVKYLSQCPTFTQVLNASFQLSKIELKELWQQAYDRKELLAMQVILKIAKQRLIDLRVQSNGRQGANSQQNILAEFKLRVDRFWIQILSMLTLDTRHNQNQILSLYLQFSKSTFEEHKYNVVRIIQYCKIIFNRIRQNHNPQNAKAKSLAEQKQTVKINLCNLYKLYQKQFQTNNKKIQKQLEEDIIPQLKYLINEIQKRDFFPFFIQIFHAHLFQLNLKFINFKNLAIDLNLQYQLQFCLVEAQKNKNVQIKLDILSVLVKYFGRFAILKNISLQLLENYIHRVLQQLVVSFDTLLQTKVQKLYCFLLNNNSLFQLKQIIIYFWGKQNKKKAQYFLKCLKKAQDNAKSVIKLRLSNRQGQIWGDHQKKIYQMDENQIQTTYQQQINIYQNQNHKNLTQTQNFITSENGRHFNNQYIKTYYNLFYQPHSMLKYFQFNYFKSQLEILNQTSQNKTAFLLFSNQFLSSYFSQQVQIIMNYLDKDYIPQTFQQTESQIKEICNRVINLVSIFNFITNRSKLRQFFFIYYTFQNSQRNANLSQALSDSLLNILDCNKLNNLIQFILFDIRLSNSIFFRFYFYLYQTLSLKLKYIITDHQALNHLNMLTQLKRMLKYWSLWQNSFSKDRSLNIFSCTVCRSISQIINQQQPLMCKVCRVGFFDRFQCMQVENQERCILIVKNKKIVLSALRQKIKKMSVKKLQTLEQNLCLMLLKHYLIQQ